MFQASLAMTILGLSASLNSFYPSGALIGMSHGFGIVVQSSDLSRRTNLENRRLVMGTLTTAVYAGQGLGPASVGPVIALGFGLGFYFTGVLMIVGVFVFYLLGRNRCTS